MDEKSERGNNYFIKLFNITRVINESIDFNTIQLYI